METNRSASISFLWKLIERIGTQGILLVISIIVARILSPREYGILAIQMVFIGLANSLVQNGLNIALVQKKQVEKVDYSTVFVLSIAASILFYIIIYVCAPYIADFYAMSELTISLRVLSVVLFISAIQVVQNAYMMRNMLFKELALSSFISSLISGGIGISCAYCGFGLWSLVAQQVTSYIFQSLLLIIITKWYPTVGFSYKSASELLKFGIPVASSYLIDVLYSDLRSLIIGKQFSSSQLGVFERAKQFPKIITTNVSNTIQAIILPVFSRNKDNKELVRNQLSQAIQMIYIIVLPALIFMCICAKHLILALLTDKWIDCVPLLIASSLMCLFWPLHAINTQTVVAMGFSKKRFYTEIVVKIIDVTLLFITVVFYKSVLSIAIGATLASLISTIIYSYPCHQILSFGFFKQMRLLIPFTVYACISSAIMLYVGHILAECPSISILIIEIVIGSLVYICLTYIYSKSKLLNFLKMFRRKSYVKN